MYHTPTMVDVSHPDHGQCITPRLWSMYHTPTMVNVSHPDYGRCITPRPWSATNTILRSDSVLKETDTIGDSGRMIRHRNHMFGKRSFMVFCFFNVFKRDYGLKQIYS